MRATKLFIVIEAASVTGPVKNMLRFLEWTRTAEARERIRIEPEIATYVREPDRGKTQFIEAVQRLGVPLHLLPERGRFDLSLLPKLRELALAVKPDILQTHNVKTNFLVKAAGLHRVYPWISFQHGYTATDLKMRAYNQLDRWSLRSATRVVTVCQAFTRQLVASGVRPDRLRVLHNSVEVPAASLRTPDPGLLVTIGRFSKEKGVADLIEALALLPGDLACRVALVGTGPDEAMLRELAAKRGLAERVEFAGFHKDVMPWYAKAAVLVSPSHSEGSPNVILEAMANGVPVAATSAGGTPEIVTHGKDGLLSPVRDPAALAANIERLLKNPALGAELAAEARVTAESRFSPDEYRRKLVAIYREAHKDL